MSKKIAQADAKRQVVPFPNNPRKITDEALLRLGESMSEFGSLDGFVVNVSPGRYENVVVSGNQKNRHVDLNQADIEISKRLESPTAAGTVAFGFVVFNGERFPYREVFWSESKCEIANLRANNFGGHNDLELLEMFDTEILISGGIDIDFERQVDEIRVAIDGIEGSGGHGKGAAVEDDYEVPEQEATRTDIVGGDLIEFLIDGKVKHRLLCGDSGKPEDVKSLMGVERADMVFTDPPLRRVNRDEKQDFEFIWA